MRLLGSFVKSIADRIIAVSFAILFLQLPHLIHQYTVALSGALYESTKTVKAIKKSARKSNKSIDAFIEKHLRNSDPDFIASGKVMQAALLRYRNYKESLKSLNDANAFVKPFVFLAVVDWSLVKSMNYKPGLSLSIVDGIYALVGILFGLALFHGFLALLSALFKKRKKQPTEG